jgi:hypothetical protein
MCLNSLGVVLTFYGRNCCPIVIDRVYATDTDFYPSLGVEYQSGSLQPCLQIFDEGGSEWQWQTL